MRKITVRLKETSSAAKDDIYDKVDKTAEKEYAKKDQDKIAVIRKQLEKARETLKAARKNKTATTGWYSTMETKIKGLSDKIEKIRNTADQRRNK